MLTNFQAVLYCYSVGSICNCTMHCSLNAKTDTFVSSDRLLTAPFVKTANLWIFVFPPTDG